MESHAPYGSAPKPIKSRIVPMHEESEGLRIIVGTCTILLSAMWLWAGTMKLLAAATGKSSDPALASAVREQLRSSILHIHPDAFYSLLATWMIGLGLVMLISKHLKSFACVLSAITVVVFTIVVVLAAPEFLGEGASCGCMEIGVFDVKSLSMLAVRNAAIAGFSLSLAVAWRKPKADASVEA